MKWHGNEQIGRLRHQPNHMARDCFGIGDASAIFQPKNQGAGDRIIGDRRTNACMDWRLLQTGAAKRVVAAIMREGQITSCAPRRRQQSQFAPTIATKLMISHRYDLATGTARWQRQIGDKPERSDQLHCPLSGCEPIGTSIGVDNIDIFDRAVRRRRRDRAANDYSAHDFLRAYMIEGLLDRLSSVSRSFSHILDLGAFDAGFPAPDGARIVRLDSGLRFAALGCGVAADEDRLPFADASFDLVVSAGVLDGVNDLPGALTLVRRILRPDGLFLAAFTGAGSLTKLQSALRHAEGDRPAARIHPQIDVRSAGDLLMRAGFALPVADVETLNVRYGSILGLLADLRGMAASNIMPGRVALSRSALMRAADAFAALADADGKISECFNIVFLTGWSPSATQPQPAKRGSATRSLTEVLKPKP